MTMTRKDMDAEKMNNQRKMFKNEKEKWLHIFWCWAILTVILLPLTDFNFYIVFWLFTNIMFFFGIIDNWEWVVNAYKYSRRGWGIPLSKDRNYIIIGNRLYKHEEIYGYGTMPRLTSRERMLILLAVMELDVVSNVLCAFGGKTNMMILSWYIYPVFILGITYLVYRLCLSIYIKIRMRKIHIFSGKDLIDAAFKED